MSRTNPAENTPDVPSDSLLAAVFLLGMLCVIGLFKTDSASDEDE